MSTRRTKATGPLTQEVLLVNATGLALGTPEAPLQTGTSSLQTTPDLSIAKIGPITAITASGTIVAAVASTKVRVYSVRMNVGGANVVSILDGATVLERLNFVAGVDKVLDFRTRPWYTTTTGAALNFSTSTATELNLIAEYTQVA